VADSTSAPRGDKRWREEKHQDQNRKDRAASQHRRAGVAMTAVVSKGDGRVKKLRNIAASRVSEVPPR
jgi:hypothetical protein